jgi:hypothetical protein
VGRARPARHASIGALIMESLDPLDGAVAWALHLAESRL